MWHCWEGLGKQDCHGSDQQEQAGDEDREEAVAVTEHQPDLLCKLCSEHTSASLACINWSLLHSTVLAFHCREKTQQSEHINHGNWRILNSFLFYFGWFCRSVIGFSNYNLRKSYLGCSLGIFFQSDKKKCICHASQTAKMLNQHFFLFL